MLFKYPLTAKANKMIWNFNEPYRNCSEAAFDIELRPLKQEYFYSYRWSCYSKTDVLIDGNAHKTVWLKTNKRLWCQTQPSGLSLIEDPWNREWKCWISSIDWLSQNPPSLRWENIGWASFFNFFPLFLLNRVNQMHIRFNCLYCFYPPLFLIPTKPFG